MKKQRNPIAKSMRLSGLFKPQAIPSKKLYKRKEKHNERNSW